MNSVQMKLSEACTAYLEAQSGKDTPLLQQELLRFARWYGRDRPANSITPTEVEAYCTTLEGIGDDRNQRLDITKKFLQYLHRQGIIGANLAAHAKIRRTGRKPAAQRIQKEPSSNKLTAEGYQRLQEELTALKAQRGAVAEEIRLAAATKDVSENSPLDAAREQQGQLEARIRDIEALLKDVVVLDEEINGRQRSASRVEVGSRVVLKHAHSGKEVSYLLVHSSEADPASGKISDASPVGRAVMDKAVGEEVQVVTPRGPVSYVVSQIQ